MKIFKSKLLIIPIIIFISSLSFLAYTNLSYRAHKDKSYLDFKNDFSSNNILKVYFSTNNKLLVTLKSGDKYLTENPETPNFKESLLNKSVIIETEKPQSLSTVLPSLGIMISVFWLAFYFMNNKRFSTSNGFSPKVVSDNIKTNYDFDKVAGNDEAKESLKDVVDFLINPDKYVKYGARIPKGVILYGEPGTGKTLLAKAVAGEANVPFYAMSGSDFMQMYVGVGASRIRDLFKKAKEAGNGKALIFIDEIDAIGKKRDGGKQSSGSDERDQTLNALLTEMSGFTEKEGIVVIAATNRLDILDPALLRPGRFDRHIEVSLPDINAREKILKLHLDNKPYSDINIRDIAEKTAYFSGAKLESLINESAILAAKKDTEFITMEHISTAFDIVVAGYEKKDRDYLSEKDRKITAYHEGGHALCSLIRIPEDKVSKVTIIPTTKGAGGYTLTIPKDSSYQTISHLKNRIMVLLAGRAAEEIIFGKDNITTGAYGDLKSSTEIIISMLSEYGMGANLGLLKMSSLGSMGNSYGNLIIEEAKELLENLYTDTKNLLHENIDTLHLLAKELLEKETISSNDLEAIITN
ncbi:ATP-dependent metallopeptidase FtsH/Yme1/Tma family protein [Clostridium paridis]|uniref:ATP-dependent zinc metalloprotease FtsH n=1 Tax=Clostridium paridis TaxID=2803863 RepID=A0A937FEB1_9CLOT|nr:AAA family ATPase [Clostridium paridis]MBL4932435.1 AAA family ATPase [Clostridium paridis]